MGLFGLFSKKEKPDPFTLRDDVRLKKINVNYISPNELLPQMRENSEIAGKLVSVNYYATKVRFIEAFLYYSEDYSQSKIQLCFYVNEKPEKTSEFFELNFKTLQKLLSKVGMYIEG